MLPDFPLRGLYFKFIYFCFLLSNLSTSTCKYILSALKLTPYGSLEKVYLLSCLPDPWVVFFLRKELTCLKGTQYIIFMHACMQQT